MEEFAFLLDILPEGRPDSQRRFRRESIVYGIGSEEYKIFEMEPIKEASLSIGDKVYIGKDHDLRNQIESVKARVKYNDLTHTAKSELPFILDEIIKSQEEKFVQFYNNAGPISRRYHSLELLPGLGKKTMQGIIGCRPFVTFQEIEDKVQGFKNPAKYISARIEHEIKVQDQKYRLFVR